ncbi:uncharacterized protein Z519_01334 [Cladophialophora bantiana CBS 173.52]|uniref:3-oxoacyl-[acyl-carrier protein] reductase n=1 Tax=Cladophialophora bantiana (strain ATCC 10958 / CBS 173.52 / CDC B-1940 / NIH 8579) TaxID=1442370 RepID=A0A0D2I3G1_CLAB1|nr:uncharacterized protein Z519_01334 [Cladophialophora bantiana CBS 173.52]KIW97750.1 hypothetical protein Z519_01334 [Cladophialophora bantiana CBS 173.52]
MQLLNGVALVTGGGSGIGRAVALACATSGCRAIVIADVNQAALQDVEHDIVSIRADIQVLPLLIDVSKPESVTSMVRKSTEAFGRLDYVTGPKISVKARVSASKYPTEEYDDIQAVNARGLLLCVQSEIQAMSEQEPAVTVYTHSPVRAQRGSIVNIGSTCSFSVIPKMFPYVVSKHAVVGITKSAGIDHAAEKIRINAVCPGLVETPMIARRRQQVLVEKRDKSSGTLSLDGNATSDTWKPADMYNTPMGRLAQPDEVADTCIFLASSMASHITATCITIDGGRSASY